MNTELKEWEVKPGAKRCAAVSSFGVSGTNAHMVIEEAPEVIRKHPVQPGYLLVLSARSEEALQKQAQQLINYSNENQEDVGDICYTLLVGRQHFKHRLSCVVRDQHDMVAQLEQWLENKAVSSVFTHVVHEREHREQPALKSLAIIASARAMLTRKSIWTTFQRLQICLFKGMNSIIRPCLRTDNIAGCRRPPILLPWSAIGYRNQMRLVRWRLHLKPPLRASSCRRDGGLH